MATVSGFGFSGTDHPNTIFENMVGRYFGKKRAEDTAALNYAFAKRYAENSPMWSVTGLRKAGLNPILAASGGFSPSMGSSVQVTDNVQSNGGSSGGESPFAITRANRQVNLLKKQTESNIKNQESQAALNNAQAKATTMKAQADVALTNARLKQVNQEVENIDKGGGYRNPFFSDANRFLNELYSIPHDEFVDSYLNHGPMDEVIELEGGRAAKPDGTARLSPEARKVRIDEFFRRVKVKRDYLREKEREKARRGILLHGGLFHDK